MHSGHQLTRSKLPLLEMQIFAPNLARIITLQNTSKAALDTVVHSIVMAGTRAFLAVCLFLVSASCIRIHVDELDRPLHRVSESERIASGLPSNICPDSSFSLFQGTYSYFCYQSSHPVQDDSAQPWCPLYAISALSTIGIYAEQNASMACPPNTVHTVSSLATMPPNGKSTPYDFCFYKIPVFPQQSSWFSYCYHWYDPSFTTGVGYAFVWNSNLK